MNPLLLVDSYKVHHNLMYEPGMTLLYSNLTPRKSRMSGVNEVVVFGTQYFIKEYLIYRFNKYFFEKPLEEIIAQYKEQCLVDTTHIEELHKLGYLPLLIKALPEGTLCPIGVPCLTIQNTHEKFGWLTNYIETLLSCVIWQPMTSATISYQYKKLLEKYALETTGSPESGRITNLPSLLNISSFNCGKYSVHTFHKSHVSLTTDKMPVGYSFNNLLNVSISPSFWPIHITECSVAGTLAPINPSPL